jgi:glyoxylase-like metal-dependent hydrolase (beta-lactamase superfamily II)
MMNLRENQLQPETTTWPNSQHFPNVTSPPVNGWKTTPPTASSKPLPGLTLLETSGHVPGHQSVLVRLPETGPVLLAIDAVVLGRFFTPDRLPWPMDADAEQTRASTRKLLDVVEREYGGLVVFHHDGEQWATLRKSPGWCE